MANKRRRKANQSRPRQQTARTAATGTEERERPAASRPRQQRPQQQQGGTRVRAEKKELARRQREEIRKRIARKRRARQLLTLSVISVAIAAVVLFITRPKETAIALPGVLTTQAPWDANAAQSPARARALGLPAQGTTLHTHSDLQIFVHGQQETVPADIGITDAGVLQSLHTHDASGVIHVESTRAQTFRLSDLFGVWGVRLTPSCLGGYCNGSGNTLQVFVNGLEITGDPPAIALDDQSVIVITYGTSDELPNPIPSTFDFASVSP